MGPTSKVCSKCMASKPPEAFSRNQRNRDGLADRCRPCHVAAVVESQRRHPSAARERRKLYKVRHRERLVETKRAQTREYYRRHHLHEREVARARNARNREHLRELRCTPEGQLAARARKALRAARCRANGTLPARLGKAFMADLLRRFGGACVYCGSTGDLETDHFVALVNNGAHSVGNIVLSCSRCNELKAQFDPFAWMEERGVDTDRVVAGICAARAA
jgi:5-methylcytosine-specific restriction endonuclease McrA